MIRTTLLATGLFGLTAFIPAEVAHRGAARALARPAATRGIRGIQATTTVTDVVTAANAFLATLSTTQQGTAVVAYSAANAVKWSNLPCGLGCREGLQLGNLTSAQVAAALAVVQAATGTVAGDGYDETQQIRAADDNLSTQPRGGNGYGAGIYFIAFVGTPSTTGTWQLQYGGHHLATNITFVNGSVAGATPKFEGVEPLSFTTANSNVLPTGTACAPLANEASTMLAMLNGLTATQKATAKLSQTFSDVVLGPGQDGNFPTTKVGLPVSSLSADQQALVLAAMKPWVQDADDATAAALLATYQGQLANTYISYSGTGQFTTNGDYARIDGPNVWIEFVCQTGVIYQTQTHYHSIWRDHARDYGGNFYTTVLGAKTAATATDFTVYPIPAAAGGGLHVQLPAAATGTCTLRNSLGQLVATSSFQGATADVPTAGLAAGSYVLSVQAAGQAPVNRHVLLQ